MKAKRGDSVAIVTESRDYVIGRPTVTATRVELGTVTSVTREGSVKAYRSAGWPDSTSMPVDRVAGFKQLLVIPSTMVRPEDVTAVAMAHHWPGHPNQPQKFDSLDEVREALRPYRIEQAV